MVVVTKLQISAAGNAKTTSAPAKTEKIRQSMTVPTQARKLRILCLHGYLQNAEVGNFLIYVILYSRTQNETHSCLK